MHTYTYTCKYIFAYVILHETRVYYSGKNLLLSLGHNVMILNELNEVDAAIAAFVVVTLHQGVECNKFKKINKW